MCLAWWPPCYLFIYFFYVKVRYVVSANANANNSCCYLHHLLSLIHKALQAFQWDLHSTSSVKHTVFHPQQTLCPSYLLSGNTDVKWNKFVVLQAQFMKNCWILTHCPHWVYLEIHCYFQVRYIYRLVIVQPSSIIPHMNSFIYLFAYFSFLI